MLLQGVPRLFILFCPIIY